MSWPAPQELHNVHVQSHSTTSDSPPLVYPIGIQAEGSMAEMALTTDSCIRTSMVKPTSSRCNVAMVRLDQVRPDRRPHDSQEKGHAGMICAGRRRSDRTNRMSSGLPAWGIRIRSQGGKRVRHYAAAGRRSEPA